MRQEPIIPCAFSFMLADFHEMIEETPSVEKIKAKLLALKLDAETNSQLTSRQKEAITARVNNYINGNYGNTKHGVKMKTT